LSSEFTEHLSNVIRVNIIRISDDENHGTKKEKASILHKGRWPFSRRLGANPVGCSVDWRRKCFLAGTGGCFEFIEGALDFLSELQSQWCGFGLGLVL
jgi:hypothetical protein